MHCNIGGKISIHDHEYLKSSNLAISLVPRCGGGGGERAPGTHCLRMRLIATEFRGDRVCRMLCSVLIVSLKLDLTKSV